MDLCNPETSGSFDKHWRYFIDTGDSNIAQIREVILRSWQRCFKSGVEPYDRDLHDRLQGDDLAKALRLREGLISVAHPFMADLYAIVRGSGFVVVLTNEDGYILELFGDEGAGEMPLTSNFFIGASWHEKDAGTNAIGTAIEEQKPVQVSGPEHYCRKHHCLTCSAAPIFDPDDRLIGILDISGAYEGAHLHTLGMVVAAAKAIIAQLRIRIKNHQLAMANRKLVSFFNMVSDGVLILDRDGTITELNPAAERIIGRNRAELKGVRFARLLIGEGREKRGAIDWSTASLEREIHLETGSGPCPCLVSAEPIPDEQESVTGICITLRPIKAVQHLVHRFSGYSASLQFDDIIGKSREMEEAVELAKLSAQTASNVLLQGESGTGKEIFAQAIHNQSGRRGAPFIPLNCGAIPRDLVGSELFGYEDGAFTGASRGGKPGKFELADGGTLFLDEIGDMPLEQQAVLLRVIQEKRMTRIGGIKVIPVDVRLICATHKNLLEQVRKGTFRQDLYYRLNVMSITIPPLRERIHDIPLLFQHFLDKLCRDRGHRLTVDRDLMHYLYAYSWPGNVRELQNVVERARNLAINGRVSVHQLPGEIVNRQRETAPEPTEMLPPVNRRQRISQRNERDKQQILHLLDVHEGNVTQVARELGVSRKTIYNRMTRLAIAN
ncbi:MAG: sigma-54-dependent Fis family transcriptional regulator [Desulforhopalus sp.]|nr:sigma-54-dependent Fis family transcriptional regulator [Desulforhopalus sp.]